MAKKKSNIIELKQGFTRNQVATSSAITTAKTNMNATELKAFYQVATLIKKDDADFQEYSIGVQEFCNELGLNSSNRDFVVKTLKSLLKQGFEIDEQDGDYIGYTIFSKLHYKRKEQKINIKFNDEIKPFLLQLKNNFTQIKQVKYIKELESKYSIRIYALLKNARLMSQLDITIDELKTMFQLGKAYDDFGQIKRRILTPAFDEINEKTDLEIESIEPLEKQGKKIVSIRIKFGNRGDKIAIDIVKELEATLKKSKSYSSFRGFPFSSQKPKGMSEIITISDVLVEKHHKTQFYYTAKSQQATLFSSGDQKSFNQSLFNGIFNALEFKANSEKPLQLETSVWQEQQDKLQTMKELLSSYRTKAQKLNFNYVS